MVDKKTQLLADFYTACLEKGYTDMRDPTQSLKAKVIATDMKLNYGDIVKFFETARDAHALVLQAEEAHRQEEIRRSVDGVLLVTLYDRLNAAHPETEAMGVYMRPDKTVYTQRKGGRKVEGIPQIQVSKGGTIDYTYHPSKAIYTSATVGGITTGGVHYTKEGYSSKINSTGKGYLEVKTAEGTMLLNLAVMSDRTIETYRRDMLFRSLVHDGQIRCSQENGKAIVSALSGTGNYQSKMSDLSRAVDATRLPYPHCVDIANLLGRIIHGEVPPSDEVLYSQAEAMARSSSAEEIRRAADLFRVISDYRDSNARAAFLDDRYQDVLQAEKEQAILAKESRKKARKLIALIGIPLVAAVIAGSLFLSGRNREREKAQQEAAALQDSYNAAVELLEQEQYQAAVEAFLALGDYQDSTALLEQAKEGLDAQAIENEYRNALALIESGRYIEARFKLQNLGDYKDSRALLETVEIPAFKESLSKMQTGHTVTFGSYEQDNDPDNGKEPIEWIVLNDSRSGYVILISSSILDVRQFNAERDYTVWEDSDLRKWLNGEFFREAFPSEKQAFMDAVPLANPDDAWGTDNGNDTNDCVFVLNMYERQDWKLLNTAPATLYAQSLGLSSEASWVLRTVHKRDAYDHNIAMMSNSETNHFDTFVGIRPCIGFYVGS